MSSTTKIEWSEQSWNPIIGCSLKSPGCTNCYAMPMAARLAAMGHASYQGLTQQAKTGAVWTGKLALNEKALIAPLKRKKPTTYFVNSMGDLFHENVPDDWIDRVFAVMALCPQHTFQVLTKRSGRMREYFANPILDELNFKHLGTRWAEQLRDLGFADFASKGGPPFPFPNVWLGVSVEDQTRANERIPDLLATPAAVRWLSCEPLLGPVDLMSPFYAHSTGYWMQGFLRDKSEHDDFRYWAEKLDWVVCGGESGKDARPMHPDWARQLRDQCAAAGVPYFFKQWGEWAVALDRERDDPDWRKDYSTKYADHGKTKWLNIEGGCGFHGARFHVMQRIGKKPAGRTLDGIEHNAMPKAARIAGAPAA